MSRFSFNVGINSIDVVLSSQICVAIIFAASRSLYINSPKLYRFLDPFSKPSFERAVNLFPISIPVQLYRETNPVRLRARPSKSQFNRRQRLTGALYRASAVNGSR